MELKPYLITTFAAAEYGCDAYGENAYNECSAETGSSAGGGLADTGYDIIIPFAIGLSIVIASLILLAKRLWRRRKSTT